MTGPITAPCLDHRRPTSACRLDLARVSTRISELQTIADAMRQDISRRVHDCAARPLAVENGVRRDARALGKVIGELRTLYAVRAHHRGHVHELTHHRYADLVVPLNPVCKFPDYEGPHLWRRGREGTRVCSGCRLDENAAHRTHERAMLSYQRSEVEEVWDSFDRTKPPPEAKMLALLPTIRLVARYDTYTEKAVRQQHGQTGPRHYHVGEENVREGTHFSFYVDEVNGAVRVARAMNVKYETLDMTTPGAAERRLVDIVRTNCAFADALLYDLPDAGGGPCKRQRPPVVPGACPMRERRNLPHLWWQGAHFRRECVVCGALE